MCWALVDDQLDNCNCITFPTDDRLFFEDISKMINYFVSNYKKKADKYDGLVKEHGQHLRHHMDLEQENKRLKEKIGTVLAESHIANEQMTTANLEIRDLKEIVEKIKIIIIRWDEYEPDSALGQMMELEELLAEKTKDKIVNEV